MTRSVFLLLVASLACFGCAAGEGTGDVKSDRLFVEDCWNGPFDLDPTFFAAVPYRDSQLIRIQRGDDIEEVSDGLIVGIDGVDGIRTGRLGEAIDVGLPAGVVPPGASVNPDPPPVSLALYLHDTCHTHNGTVYSIGGTITFRSLFSGNPNEADADARLTDASFDAEFADPRDIQPNGEYPPGRVSNVTGSFRFFFQRGQPAQPFP